MNPLALVLVLVAAVLHATWNILLKTSGDPLRVAGKAMTASAVLTAPLALAGWFLLGRPPFGAWLLAGLSAGLETAYLIFLSAAYRRGDLSLVYPLARGTAPLLAVLAGLLILHERLGPLRIAGVACLLAGIWCVRRPAPAGAATLPALLAGVTIAAYSTVDAAGVHRASPWLYGWIMWAGTATFLGAWIRFRGSAGAVVPSWRESIPIGLMMAATYLMILVALRLAPLVLVSPLRESAIVLVTLWGVWRLHERSGRLLRLAGAGVILAGSALLTFAG